MNKWRAKRKWRDGADLTRFIARDVRREIHVIDASELAEGYVVARVRTRNVLYESKGLKILPHIGDYKLSDVEPSHLDRLYVTLLVSGGEEGQPLAPNSVRRVHIAISGLRISRAVDLHSKAVCVPANRAHVVVPSCIGASSNVRLGCDKCVQL